MTDYASSEIKQNLESGAFFVASAANNGANIDVNFTRSRPNSTYKVKLTILIADVTTTKAYSCWVSARSTLDFTAQVRLINQTGAVVSDSVGAEFTIFWECWE